MNMDADFKPVPTRAALALQKKNKSADFKSLVFQEPKPLRNQHAEGATSTNEDTRSRLGRLDRPEEKGKFSSKSEEFDIKKARHEVLRFAMNNQRTIKNKKKMEMFQQVKMGMKPPKKPYKNYKELLAERKRLKEIREKRKEFHQLGKNQTGAASVKCRSKTKLEKQKKKRAPVTGIDQHYGVVKPKLKK